MHLHPGELFVSSERAEKNNFFFFFFFTPGTSPRKSLSLKLSDIRVYEPQIRARLGTTAHFCRVAVLKLNRTQVILASAQFTDTILNDIKGAKVLRSKVLTFFPRAGCRESRRCSRDTYPELYSTKYASIRRKMWVCRLGAAM